MLSSKQLVLIFLIAANSYQSEERSFAHTKSYKSISKSVDFRQGPGWRKLSKYSYNKQQHLNFILYHPSDFVKNPLLYE